MPTYDYLCDNCNHEFEKFQMISANPLRKCPSCGKMQLQRLIGTGAGIIFKGNGFYETDYRSDNYKKGKEDAKPKSSDSEKKKTEKSKTTKTSGNGSKGKSGKSKTNADSKA